MFKRSQVAALNDILAKVNAMQKTVRVRHCRVARDKPETAALAGHGDLSDAPQERSVEQGVRQRRARGHCTDRGANRPGGGERRQVRLVRKRQARARHQQGGTCVVVSSNLGALLTACGASWQVDGTIQKMDGVEVINSSTTVSFFAMCLVLNLCCFLFSRGILA